MKFRKNIILIFLLLFGFKNNCAMEAGAPIATAENLYQDRLNYLSNYLANAQTNLSQKNITLNNLQKSKGNLLDFKENYKALRQHLIQITKEMNDLEVEFEGLVKRHAKASAAASTASPSSRALAPQAERAKYSPAPTPASSSTALTRQSQHARTAQTNEMTLNILFDDDLNKSLLEPSLNKFLTNIKGYKFKTVFLDNQNYKNFTKDDSNIIFLYIVKAFRPAINITTEKFCTFYNAIYEKNNPGKLIFINIDPLEKKGQEVNGTLNVIGNFNIPLNPSIEFVYLYKNYYEKNEDADMLYNHFIQALNKPVNIQGTFTPLNPNYRPTQTNVHHNFD